MSPDDRERAFAQNKASIDPRDHLDRAFPAEYADVKQDIRNTRREIREYNRNIRALRTGADRPTGPQNTLSNAGNVPRQIEDRIRELKHFRNQARTDAFDRAQERTQGASPEDQVRMHNAALEELQKGMSRAARDRQNSTRLDAGTISLNRAQDRFFEARAAGLPVQENGEPATATPQPQASTQQVPSSTSPAAYSNPSISVQFLGILSYTKVAEQPNTETKKAGLQKESSTNPHNLSASNRFLSESSLNKALEDANTHSSEQPNKTSQEPSKE